jgi:hypothetical protein
MFACALEEMKQTGVPYWGPKSFQGYCKTSGIKAPNTADHISIDSLTRLHSTLRDQKCMVLRLGAPEGERNTHFGLAKYENDWSDFFLLDRLIFEGVAPEMFIPTVSFRHLFPFYLLPAFTETSLVNLALASGLMAHALNLDEPTLPLAAATGQSTFTFRFNQYQNDFVSALDAFFENPVHRRPNQGGCHCEAIRWRCRFRPM